MMNQRFRLSSTAEVATRKPAKVKYRVKNSRNSVRNTGKKSVIFSAFLPEQTQLANI